MRICMSSYEFFAWKIGYVMNGLYCDKVGGLIPSSASVHHKERFCQISFVIAILNIDLSCA